MSNADQPKLEDQAKPKRRKKMWLKIIQIRMLNDLPISRDLVT